MMLGSRKHIIRIEAYKIPRGPPAFFLHLPRIPSCGLRPLLCLENLQPFSNNFYGHSKTMSYSDDDQVSFVERPALGIIDADSLASPSPFPPLFTFAEPRWGTLTLRDDAKAPSSRSLHRFELDPRRAYTPAELVPKPTSSLHHFWDKVNSVFALAHDHRHHKGTANESGSLENVPYDMHLFLPPSVQELQRPKKFASIDLDDTCSTRTTKTFRFSRSRASSSLKQGLRISHHISSPYPISSTVSRSFSLFVRNVLSASPSEPTALHNIDRDCLRSEGSSHGWIHD